MAGVAIRRSTRQSMPKQSGGLVALLLRIPLFGLCTAGPARARLRKGRRDHPAQSPIGSAARCISTSLIPAASTGARRFGLESEDPDSSCTSPGMVSCTTVSGTSPSRTSAGGKMHTMAGKMAERLFAGGGVRLVFVSGCQSAQAGAAGLCQRLTVAGHVPLSSAGGPASPTTAPPICALPLPDLASGQPMDRAGPRPGESCSKRVVCDRRDRAARCELCDTAALRRRSRRQTGG